MNASDVTMRRKTAALAAAKIDSFASYPATAATAKAALVDAKKSFTNYNEKYDFASGISYLSYATGTPSQKITPGTCGCPQ